MKHISEKYIFLLGGLQTDSPMIPFLFDVLNCIFISFLRMFVLSDVMENTHTGKK